MCNVTEHKADCSDAYCNACAPAVCAECLELEDACSCGSVDAPAVCPACGSDKGPIRHLVGAQRVCYACYGLELRAYYARLTEELEDAERAERALRRRADAMAKALELSRHFLRAAERRAEHSRARVIDAESRSARARMARASFPVGL